MNTELGNGASVEVRDISKEYVVGSGVKSVLSGISFSAKPGEILGICGLSGVGKSTLLRVIAGLIPVTSGHIHINGQIVSKPGSGIGYVTQDYSRSLFPWLTVSKNVLLAFKSTSIPKDIQREKVSSILKSLGLADAERLFPWQLSGGMQQRVAIARALVNQPTLLLLDEPFASVDAHVRLELEDLLAKLVEDFGVTTILITHDIDEAIYLSDRVITLTGSPAQIGLELAIDLPRPRTQTTTRSTSHFSEFRTKLYLGLRHESGE